MIRYFLVLSLVFYACNHNPHKKSYKLSEKEKITNVILSKVAHRLNNQYGLIPAGNGGQMMDQIEMLCLVFDYRKPLPLREARQLIVNAVNEFTTAINEDERIRPYLANYPFEPKNIELTIFLRDANGRRVPDGNLLIIDADKGFIKYKFNDPVTDKHTLIMKETFEEAEQRLGLVK